MTSRGAIVELCAGMGGIGIGLRALGLTVDRAYDSWPEAVSVYNRNCSAPANVATQCDLLSNDGCRIVAAGKEALGDIELVAAGPPCKGFSQLKNGHHDGRKSYNKAHNSVLTSIPEYIALLRPRLLVIENVPALVIHRGGQTLRRLLERLQQPAPGLRYRLEWQIYDAAQYGTPQARRRLIILGVWTNGDGGEHLPPPGPDLSLLYAAIRHGKPVPNKFEDHHQELLDCDRARMVTASQALSDLPELNAGESECPRTYRCKPESAYQRWARSRAPLMLTGTRTPAVLESTTHRLSYIPPGGCARDIPKRYLNGLTRRFDSAYRRLHPDAPSTALSTKYDCVYHYAQPRSLSLREYARLQGMPDSIVFPEELVCRRSAYEMIGNSVPPLLVEGILREVLRIEHSATLARGKAA